MDSTFLLRLFDIVLAEIDPVSCSMGVLHHSQEQSLIISWNDRIFKLTLRQQVYQTFLALCFSAYWDALAEFAL
jgi:hypothetical protein